MGTPTHFQKRSAQHQHSNLVIQAIAFEYETVAIHAPLLQATEQRRREAVAEYFSRVEDSDLTKEQALAVCSKVLGRTVLDLRNMSTAEVEMVADFLEGEC